MFSKYDYITFVADETVKKVTESPKEWMNFLKTASRIYRYPFNEQLLIYAQRPDATACASIDIWNDRMHCWVNKGAKGIALIDDRFPNKHKLKYVFDVSDVHKSWNGGILPKRWEMKSEYESEVIKRLESIYGKTSSVRSFPERLIELSGKIAEEYTQDILPDLISVQEDSFLSGLDEYNVGVEIRETLSSSIAYMLLTRCDIDADTYIDDFKFDFIRDFNSPSTLCILGDAVSEMSEPILRDIYRVVEALDRKKEIGEKRLENNSQSYYNALTRESGVVVEDNINIEGGSEYGADLQERRGLPDTGSGLRNGAGREPDEVRDVEGDIPKESSSRDLFRKTADGDAQRTLPDDTETGRGESREDNQLYDEDGGRDRGTESERPDGVGTQDELDNEQSGRDSDERDSLQLVTGLDGNITAEVKYEQISMFPTVLEQKGTIAAVEAKSNASTAFSFSEGFTQEEIDHVLCGGSGFQNGKYRIYEYALEGHDTKEFADFLKNEYGIGGRTGSLQNVEHSYEDHSAKGIKISKGDIMNPDAEILLNWKVVAKRISELVYEDKYLTKEQLAQYEQKQLEEVQAELTIESHEAESGADVESVFPHLSDELKAEQDKQSQKVENYHITDYDLGVGTSKEKYQRNVEAIKTLQTVEAEGRAATPEEQETMSKYVGWGGLSDAFDDTKSGWQYEYAELKELLTPEEYSSARSSTLNAHYTSPTIIRGIYQTLERFGFEKGNILEPSMGIGNFFGMLPPTMEKSRLFGVELDDISGRIAKQLYPNAKIEVKGFEETTFPNDFFDVAIGNVPFGQYKVLDKEYDKKNFMIHDYFFAKTLDKVRPGGVVAFVTSKGTMDKASENVRQYLAERAEFMGGVRLPNTAFKANAGTEVTSDILFFKKRDRLVMEEPDWVHTKENKDGILMNSYFADNPEQVVGRMEMISGPFGPESACLPDTDRDFDTQLNDSLSNIEGYIDLPQIDVDELGSDIEDRTLSADPNVKNFSYTIIDDEVYYRENSIMKPVEMPDTKLERIKGMVAIRDCTRELIDLQLDDVSEENIQEKQKELNKLYDDFANKFGRLNSRNNKSAFSQDSSYSLLASLEKFDSDGNFLEKADMFSKRTIKRAEVVTSVDTATEALAVSLNENAKVDIPYMASLVGKPEDSIIEELTGIIFKNPISEQWEPADEYLSGNVRDKLQIAKSYAEGNPDYEVNVRALNRVMPKDLDASEIEVRLGATWIDPEYYQQFMIETFKTPAYLTESRWSQSTVGVQYSDVTGLWNIRGKNADRNNPLVDATFGTERANAYKILEDSLNLKDSRVYDIILEDGKEKRMLNKKETTLASQRQEAIREAFKDWIFAEPERREVLVRKYNEIYNSIRPREYDGSHLNFPGMSPEITLRPHQKNAVAHQLYGNNTLLAHCVGAGKTWEMTAAAMESKRLGLCRKSLFVVPNHLTEQWGSDFLQLYPGANILVATKKGFEPANRKKFCSRIATGDYDAVIIGHTQFEKIPLSNERQSAMIEKQIDEIEAAIALAKAERGERYTIKQMENSSKQLKVKLEKLNDRSRKDDVVTFEQLGVDRLFVDESHNYKNLFLYTKMRNVGGIAQTEAQKSSDMFAKCQYLDEITGGKGVTFATGTPISNSMTELYTNMRYLQYSTLERMHLTQFDAWASSFGETQTAIELAPEGTGYRAKTRFAKFFNLPELISIFKESADIKTPDMLKLDVPEAEYKNIVLKPSEEQKEMVKALAERAERVRSGNVDASVDNMLKITNDGRKLALDQRLISDMLPENENSKAAACVEEAYKIYVEENDNKGAQLIFCDLSTPKGDGSFTVYEDIRDKLIAKGVPKEEIAFIHDANSENKKADLFAKVRSGQVRFLLGSTQKMGAGTNVQDRLIALHHLDVPWRPSDIEQQEGRIIRQGNMYKELGKPVKIFRYVTEGTFDSYSWQVIENKQKFIGQIMTSKSPVRSCEDVDEAALTYAEVKALCTGNPYIKEKMDLDIQVSKLKLLKANHTSQKYRLEDDIAKRFPAQIAEYKGRIAGYKKDISMLAESKVEDSFEIKIGGTVYTERKEAGEALIEMCKNTKAFREPLEVGEYCGFKLAVTFDAFDRKFDLNIKGAMTYHMDVGTDPTGNMTRLNNTLGSIENRLEKATTQLANVETQLETAKVEVTKPFKQEQELSEKLNRLNELNALLNMDETGDSRDELSEEYKLPDDVTLEVVTGDNAAGLLTISFFDEKQSFIFDEGISEREIIDILEEDTDTFAKLSRIGKCVTEATCAEIEQSDMCAFSLDYNCNDKTVSVYEINGGRAGLRDPDRNDDNCKYKVFDIHSIPKKEMSNVTSIFDRIASKKEESEIKKDNKDVDKAIKKDEQVI